MLQNRNEKHTCTDKAKKKKKLKTEKENIHTNTEHTQNTCKSSLRLPT
jgi:hypothetical protein